MHGYKHLVRRETEDREVHSVLKGTQPRSMTVWFYSLCLSIPDANSWVTLKMIRMECSSRKDLGFSNHLPARAQPSIKTSLMLGTQKDPRTTWKADEKCRWIREQVIGICILRKENKHLVIRWAFWQSLNWATSASICPRLAQDPWVPV